MLSEVLAAALFGDAGGIFPHQSQGLQQGMGGGMVLCGKPFAAAAAGELSSTVAKEDVGGDARGGGDEGGE